MRPPAGFTDGAVRGFVFRSLRGVVESSGSVVGATQAALAAATEAALRAAVPTVSADGVANVLSAALKLDELAMRDVGSDDNESNALAKLPAIVAHYAGHPGMLHAVTEATKQTANNDEALTWAVWVARILEAVILGVPFPDAVRVNLPRLDQPYRSMVEHAVKLAAEEADPVAGVGKLGVSCPLAYAVPAAIYLLSRSGGAAPYATVVRENIAAGGDSAGRGIIVGAISAALNDKVVGGGVPDEWLAKLVPSLRSELLALAAGIHAPVHGEVVTDHVGVHKTPSSARLSGAGGTPSAAAAASATAAVGSVAGAGAGGSA